jgi:hypothetical protein
MDMRMRSLIIFLLFIILEILVVVERIFGVKIFIKNLAFHHKSLGYLLFKSVILFLFEFIILLGLLLILLLIIIIIFIKFLIIKFWICYKWRYILIILYIKHLISLIVCMRLRPNSLTCK